MTATNNFDSLQIPFSMLSAYRVGLRTRTVMSFLCSSSRGGQNSIDLKVCTAYQILFHIQIGESENKYQNEVKGISHG